MRTIAERIQARTSPGCGGSGIHTGRIFQYARRAVTLLLQDEEWTAWSDREIARRCCVSNRFVRLVREGLSVNGSQIDQPPRKVERSGTEATMRIIWT
jgi:hypothetical protein